MLEETFKKLIACQTLEEKLKYLRTTLKVQKSHFFSLKLEPKYLVVLFQIVLIGQDQKLFEGFEKDEARFFSLLDQLVYFDEFYSELGGIIGYQKKILEFLNSSKKKEEFQIYPPYFYDLSHDTEETQEYISWGIDALDQIAEVYALGGAADRLHLLDPKTNQELPAAKLPFLGKTLFEILVQDLSAREHLYFQKFGKKIITPIAIMSSYEKNNHAHLKAICEEKNYFNRPKDSFRFFIQPLVPTVDEKGNWYVSAPLKPVLKPGGHGVIWKLARDQKIFDWFESLNKTKCLVRQINNPVSGLDGGILGLIGIGAKKEMHFGFASAPRLIGTAEGVNVLIEKNDEIVLSNIEYCDFARFQIQDFTSKEGESQYGANTNLLFADLKAIRKAVDLAPFPGLLINLKETRSSDGQERKKVARLESTMQNIADVFTEPKNKELKTKKTFLTYSPRHKAISTAKKVYLPGKVLKETPENCFYDLLFANRELLERCHFTLPERRTVEEYLEKGPEALFLYHPAIGPLYSLIEEKMQRGALSFGAELVLEIANFKIRDLNLMGSLRILASQIMGHLNEQKELIFSNQKGICILERVKIENRGVNWQKSSPFWKMDLKREEQVEILLKGRSLFIAKDVTLKGGHRFVVEDGEVLEVFKEGRTERRKLDEEPSLELSVD